MKRKQKRRRWVVICAECGFDHYLSELQKDKDSSGNHYYFCPTDETAPIAMRKKHEKLKVFSNAFGRVVILHRPVASWEKH